MSGISMIDQLLATPAPVGKDASSADTKQDAQSVGAAFSLLLALAIHGAGAQATPFGVPSDPQTGDSTNESSAEGTPTVHAAETPLVSAEHLIDAATRVGLGADHVEIEALSVSFEPLNLQVVAPATRPNTRSADVFTPAHASELPVVPRSMHAAVSLDTAPPMPTVSPTVGADSLSAVEASPLPAAPTSVGTEHVKLERANVAEVRRDPALLDATFRTKLERVVTRMRDEYGHSVELTETYRSQARQDVLHAQGRETAGSIVTWTRQSRHTDGMAADVKIDGSYDSPRAFARLAQVAREEGLRTLGPRDPGHIELPSHAASRTAPTIAAKHPAIMSAAPARVTEVAQVARVASIAPVAPVARVARVATMAQVAEPGTATRSSSNSSRSDADTRRERDGHSASRGESFAPAAERAHVVASVSPVHAPTTRVEMTESVGAPVESRAPQSVESVARLLELRDTALSRPMSHVVLRIDGQSAGTEDRIRVDVRGSNVGATLSIGDHAMAEQIGARVGELRAALERHGLEIERVGVQTGATNTANLASGDSARQQHSSDTREHAHEHARDHSRRHQQGEHQRQRSRRDHQGENSQ